MHYKFFYTSRCHRCPDVKKYLEKRKDLTGDWISADTPEGLNEARKYSVMQVPTVIFIHGEEEIRRASSVAELENVQSEERTRS